MPSVCQNCGKSKKENTRKLCWTCTNWKRHYGTTKKEEVIIAKDERSHKRVCVLCEKKSRTVVPGEYTSTGKPMCYGCSMAMEMVKEALLNPVKMFLLKDRCGLV